VRTISSGVLLVLLSCSVAHAQTFGELQIELGAYSSSTDGGEKPVGVWFSTGAVVIGKPVTATFSVGESCESFAVSTDGSLASNATAAWKIELTPTRVVRDAVTFRLRWHMAGGGPDENGRFVVRFSDSFASAFARQELELTLRPGESWPVFPVARIARYSCNAPSSIRVSVDTYPSEEAERRLVAADLWLVERLPNGSEAPRSQALSVRGLPHRPVRFYFDSVQDGAASLDVYGTLVARPGTDAMSVSVDTRSRQGRNSNPGTQRSVKSEIQLKGDETVEIRLPMFTGPFANRAFSIRIRARHIR
jgi:hypothetical protein